MGEEKQDDDQVKEPVGDDDGGAADDGGGDQRTYSAADYRKVKNEAAARRKELRDTQEKLKALQAEADKNAELMKRMSSLFSGEGDEDPEKAMQRKSAEVDKHLEKARTALLKAELITTLSRAGVSKVEDAVAVILYRGDLGACEVDLDSGKVKGLEEVVEGLKKSRSDFFEQQTRRATGPTQINGDGSTGGGGSSYGEIIAKMTPGQREAAARMAKKNGWTEDFALKRAAYLHSIGTENQLPEPRLEKADA